MKDRAKIKGYSEIIGQAALAEHMAACYPDSRVSYWDKRNAYQHAARILLDMNDVDLGWAYRDMTNAYTRLWAKEDAARRIVHTGTFRESCASHNCAGCPA
jgi:hypothetical protein